MKHEIRIPLGKQRNPFGEDYDGSHNAGRHEPKKERFKPNYVAIVEEEEHLLDPTDLDPISEKLLEEESDANWRDYLASQNVSSQSGKVTPK